MSSLKSRLAKLEAAAREQHPDDLRPASVRTLDCLRVLLASQYAADRPVEREKLAADVAWLESYAAAGQTDVAIEDYCGVFLGVLKARLREVMHT